MIKNELKLKRKRKKGIYRTATKRRLIREFKMRYKSQFFTTIAIEADIFKHGSGREHMYNDVLDFMETAYSVFEFDKFIEPDDDRIMRIAHDLYYAVRAIYINGVIW